MTVSIGAYTVQGPSIIVSADTRVSYPGAYIPSHDQVGKQYSLPFNCVASIAGSVSEAHTFIGRLVQALDELKGQDHLPYREEVMAAIDGARMQVHKQIIDQALKREIGLSLAEWHDKFGPQIDFEYSLQAFGMQTIRDNILKLATIVAGFVGDNVMFFCARAMQNIESDSSPAIYTIGSGSFTAMEALNKRQQNSAFGLARSLFHVHEAMLAAQQATPTVGAPTDYLVLMKGQPLLHLPANSSLLGGWVSYFEGKSTESLDSEDSSLALQAALKATILPPYDIALPKA